MEKIIACAVDGIQGIKVEVQVHVERGAKFYMVGLPDNAVKESHYRISAALKNNGLALPVRHIIINLAPADIRKEGSAYDLPIAIGILLATSQLNFTSIDQYLVMGELSLDGSIKAIKGVLPMAIKAKEMGLKGVIIPKENQDEAQFISELDVIAVSHLSELISMINGNQFQTSRSSTLTIENKKIQVIFQI